MAGAWIARERRTRNALSVLVGTATLIGTLTFVRTLAAGWQLVTPLGLNKNFVGGIGSARRSYERRFAG